MNIELTIEEILEDLCWPGPPPGNWRWELRDQARPDPVPARRTSERGWSELKPITPALDRAIRAV
jgi:hypothetical protein